MGHLGGKGKSSDGVLHRLQRAAHNHIAINLKQMEMYADETARAGVLEPEGAVEIKFRKPLLVATMARLDVKYAMLKQKIEDSQISMQDKVDIKAQLDARERELLPIYQQLATHFADLHDTPGRMLAKGVIRKVLQWSSSRTFLYWRIRRRLQEQVIQARLAAEGVEIGQSIQTWLQAHVQFSNHHSINWDNDESVFQLLMENRKLIESSVEKIKTKHQLLQLQEVANENVDFVLEMAANVFSTLPNERKAAFLRRLARFQAQG